MRFLPVFLDLTAGTVVLVGSGEPALNKLRLLQAAGAQVAWYSASSDLEAAIAVAADARGRVRIATGDPLSDDWSDVVAVVSGAGRPLDNELARRARRERIPVNVVDRPELSTFIV